MKINFTTYNLALKYKILFLKNYLEVPFKVYKNERYKNNAYKYILQNNHFFARKIFST